MKPKKIKKWSKDMVIDKNKLTMFDLISYNPPVTDKQLLDKEAEENREEEELNRQRPNLLNLDDEEDEKSDDESVGPRVKINEKGEIVLDEESLIIKRKKPKDQNITTVYEDDKTISTRTTYSSFKKPGKSIEKKQRWSDEETVKFYTALTIIGTDFTLMADLFFRNQRSRIDLKNKFKQEEKNHKVLIDNALKKSDLTSITNAENINLFSSDSESESNSNEVSKSKSNKSNKANKSDKAATNKIRKRRNKTTKEKTIESVTLTEPSPEPLNEESNQLNQPSN